MDTLLEPGKTYYQRAGYMRAGYASYYIRPFKACCEKIKQDKIVDKWLGYPVADAQRMVKHQQTWKHLWCARSSGTGSEQPPSK